MYEVYPGKAVEILTINHIVNVINCINFVFPEIQCIMLTLLHFNPHSVNKIQKGQIKVLYGSIIPKLRAHTHRGQTK